MDNEELLYQMKNLLEQLDTTDFTHDMKTEYYFIDENITNLISNVQGVE